jgi:outer membrane translocation and assembly module TamA
VTPTIARWLRIVAEARIQTLWNETQNRFLTLGGDNGLRGFGINQFEGQRSAVLQTELRTAPIRILVTRWGLVAFYDVGGAANSLRTMTLHHDVGGGVRVLIPQASAQLFRFDFSFPLDGPTAGSIRITAGFRSEF